MIWCYKIVFGLLRVNVDNFFQKGSEGERKKDGGGRHTLKQKFTTTPLEHSH